jgi:DNA-binding NarL/FixJ family response regulator
MRIFLIDDHELFRQGLRLILERTPDLIVVGEAGDGPSALELVERARPEVVVADIHLPKDDGIALAARILKKFPAIKVIFLSSDADFALVRRALDAGGSGYLLKDNAAHELIDAIEAVNNGGVYLCPKVALALVEDYRRHDGETPAATPKRLSKRETEVLRFIAEGLRNKEIADRLKVSTKSVETYRRRLLAKLGYVSTAELVRHAIRDGLVAP